MILAPNTQAQLVDPQTGRATTFFSKFLESVVAAFGKSASIPWTPGAIGAGATASVALAVPNATSDQMATASYSQPTAGVIALAVVSGPGTVKATLWNTTGATVTPTPGTVTALAWTP